MTNKKKIEKKIIILFIQEIGQRNAYQTYPRFSTNVEKPQRGPCIQPNE